MRYIPYQKSGGRLSERVSEERIHQWDDRWEEESCMTNPADGITEMYTGRPTVNNIAPVTEKRAKDQVLCSMCRRNPATFLDLNRLRRYCENCCVATGEIEDID